MAKPLKTTVLDNIEAAIQGIISNAERHPSVPTDRDDKTYPLAFIFDGDESNVRNNQVMVATFPIIIEIWTEDEAGMKAISDACDIWKADIEEILMPPDTQARKPYEFKLSPLDPTASKFYADDTLGGIQLQYEVTYLYPYGKPYEQIS